MPLGRDLVGLVSEEEQEAIALRDAVAEGDEVLNRGASVNPLQE